MGFIAVWAAFLAPTVAAQDRDAIIIFLVKTTK